MLQRKAMGKLIAWKERKTKQALLITGARQVGKTFLADAFSVENYHICAKFNVSAK